MSRKKLLIFPFDLLAHYLRCITLAKRYDDYEIFFASSSKYNDFVTKAGYQLFPVKNFNAEQVIAKASKFDFSWLNKSDIEDIFLSQVESITQLSPDVVIGDACPTLKMAAEKCGVKYISLINGYLSKYYAHHRPLSRTHFISPLISILPLAISESITASAEEIYFKWIHRPFRTLRKKHSLSSQCTYLDESEGDDTLICDLPELFPQKKLPSSYTIIGPLYYPNENDEVELIAQLQREKNTICISLGSSGEWSSLGFLNDKKYSKFNIIQAGGPSDFLKGSHVIKKDFINLKAVLPYCDLLICHGGNGTIYEGLRSKVFMLCLPNHFEQEWNISRLSKLGLGVCLSKSPQKTVDAYINKLFSEKKQKLFAGLSTPAD